MRLHVSMPGIIESYDRARQVADIKPGIQNLELDDDGNEILESFAILPEVPIVFQRAGPFAMTFDLKKGDSVHVVFNERSIDNWFAGDGGAVNPDVFNLHDLSDAVAYPGFYPDAKALKNPAQSGEMVLGHDTGQRLVIEQALIKLGITATEFIALASLVETEIGSQRTFFIAHTHPVPVGGSSGPPTGTPPAVGSTAATKSKAE